MQWVPFSSTPDFQFILIFVRRKPRCPNQRIDPSIYLYILQADLPCRFPILFYKPVTTLIGPLATVVIPQVAQPPKDHLPDYEVELVIVIGKAAKDVSEADALDYVLGYTGANDVCIRFSWLEHLQEYSSHFIGFLP